MRRGTSVLSALTTALSCWRKNQFISGGLARNFTATGNGYQHIEQSFAAYEGELLFGLGQHAHGRLNQKGIVLDLVQRNSEVSIPFMVSSRGYGFLWNNPAVGRVEIGGTATRWVANSARQIDYWVTAGSPAEIAASYADATGHSPVLPEWAAGFWQSKLRYRTQDELLGVAREYRRRKLPLSVIVADFFHWTQLGDWRFEPSEWPDPQAMVDELEEMGVRLAVSVWPSVSVLSANYQHMLNAGYFISNERGGPYHADWPDRHATTRVPCFFLRLYERRRSRVRLGAVAGQLLPVRYQDLLVGRLRA